MRLLLALLLLPTFAAAGDRPLTAQEFERMVTGKTYSYSLGGDAYGAEEYLDNRRVRWTFLDGECFEGEWYAAGEQICFVYETIPDPQCWHFFVRAGELSARFAGQSVATDLFETAPSDEPLYCLGPKIGV